MTCFFIHNLEEICQTYFMCRACAYIVQGMAELTRKGRNLYILLTIGRIE